MSPQDLHRRLASTGLPHVALVLGVAGHEGGQHPAAVLRGVRLLRVPLEGLDRNLPSAFSEAALVLQMARYKCG